MLKKLSLLFILTFSTQIFALHEGLGLINNLLYDYGEYIRVVDLDCRQYREYLKDCFKDNSCEKHPDFWISYEVKTNLCRNLQNGIDYSMILVPGLPIALSSFLEE